MLNSIQVLRAVAALLVLFAHLWTPFTRFGAGDKFPNFSYGAAGVDLFFVISGFIMVYSSERFFAQPLGSTRFMLRRLARIAPLYWATTTVVLLMVPLLGNTLAMEDSAGSHAVASYLFIPYARPSGTMTPLHGPGWTLEYEMFFYAVFALCVALPRRQAVIAACSTLTVFMFLPMLAELPAAIAYLVKPYLLEFTFGMLIAFAYRKGLRIPRFSAACMIVGPLLVYVWTWTMPINMDFSDHYRHVVWGGSAALILASCVLSPFQWRTRWLGPFVLMGDASFALYLTHTITLDVVGLSVAKRLPGTHPYVFASLMAFSAIAVALIVYKCFERPLTIALNARAEDLLRAKAVNLPA